MSHPERLRFPEKKLGLLNCEKGRSPRLKRNQYFLVGKPRVSGLRAVLENQTTAGYISILFQSPLHGTVVWMGVDAYICES